MGKEEARAIMAFPLRFLNARYPGRKYKRMANVAHMMEMEK